jgi:valyl-tRNA synthetase
MKLPKKYKPAEAEQKWQRHWEERGIYKFDKFPDRPIYSIDTPPPTVSGKILEDARAQRLLPVRVRRQRTPE